MFAKYWLKIKKTYEKLRFFWAIKCYRRKANTNSGFVPRKNLRLIYITGEPDSPSHIYRVERPAETASFLGVDVSILRVGEVSERLNDIVGADMIIIFRAPLDYRLQEVIKIARKHAIKIGFDVDDLMIRPDLATINKIDGIRTQGFAEDGVRMFYELIRATLLKSDFCIATTDELASEMRKMGKWAVVLPNGLDYHAIETSRIAVRHQNAKLKDNLIRIGYAGGTLTHQHDFMSCADAVADVLRERPNCRLVLFHKHFDQKLLDIKEFPSFEGLEEQIEWREFVVLESLPCEIARFDINLAPLEVGNPYCEAKSELKYFEAAMVDVPTVASPTGPFSRAICQGVTGFLATTTKDWYQAITRLIDDNLLRCRITKAAKREVIWRFGMERRTEIMASIFDTLNEERISAHSFALDIKRNLTNLAVPEMPDYEIIFEADSLNYAKVTIVIPLYNYAQYVEEALNSVKAQTLAEIDLIVVDNCSEDDSLKVALNWMRRNANRFCRALLVLQKNKASLGHARNLAFELADSPYVAPLDADNRLLPEFASSCLRAIENSRGAAYVYPVLRFFGNNEFLMGTLDYEPRRLIHGNYIDAMTLISKAAWVLVGGYQGTMGWEDYDLWCKFAEFGLWGKRVAGEPLAEYRDHAQSKGYNELKHNSIMQQLVLELEAKHSWLNIHWPKLEKRQ